jgi:hypothetical protein
MGEDLDFETFCLTTISRTQKICKGIFAPVEAYRRSRGIS